MNAKLHPLADALRAAGIEGDELTSASDRLDARQKRLHHRRTLLATGSGWVADMEWRPLALMALEDLAVLLKAGQPNQETLAMLAEFISDVVATSERSEKHEEESAHLAVRILRCQRIGAQPDRALREARAVATYQSAIDTGDTESVALTRAYDALRGDGDQYMKDRARGGQQAVTGSAGVTSTVADRVVKEDLLPLLRRAGLVSRRPAGRKKAKSE